MGKADHVDLTLGPATDTSFVVFGPDGRPVAGALVEPYRVLTPINLYTSPPAAIVADRRSWAVTDAERSARRSRPCLRGGFRREGQLPARWASQQ